VNHTPLSHFFVRLPRLLKNTDIRVFENFGCPFDQGWLMGVEPTTLASTVRCSAIELQPPYERGEF
jgi:hypothetical protein